MRIVVRGDLDKVFYPHSDTYGAAAELETLRLLIVLAIVYDLDINLYDVTQAYLQAILPECVNLVSDQT